MLFILFARGGRIRRCVAFPGHGREVGLRRNLWPNSWTVSERSKEMVVVELLRYYRIGSRNVLRGRKIFSQGLGARCKGWDS